MNVPSLLTHLVEMTDSPANVWTEPHTPGSRLCQQVLRCGVRFYLNLVVLGNAPSSYACYREEQVLGQGGVTVEATYIIKV